MGRLTPRFLNSKYRVLDDCARLRDIVASLPEDRHFVPSVLFIVWGEGWRVAVPDELLIMVGREFRILPGFLRADKSLSV